MKVGIGNTQPVGDSWNRRSVEHEDQVVGRILGLSDKRNRAPLPVVKVDPFKTGWLEVYFVQRTLALIEAIEVFDQSLQPLVRLVLKQMPIEARVVAPFAPLPELRTHEEQLLAGVPVHVSVKQPEIGKLLPEVSWHFIEQCALPVDDLIVGERQNEVLVEGINQAEGEGAVM